VKPGKRGAYYSPRGGTASGLLVGRFAVVSHRFTFEMLDYVKRSTSFEWRLDHSRPRFLRVFSYFRPTPHPPFAVLSFIAWIFRGFCTVKHWLVTIATLFGRDFQVFVAVRGDHSDSDRRFSMPRLAFLIGSTTPRHRLFYTRYI